MYVAPTQKQIDFLNWEMGVFFHFGIRTYYEGHRDWDNKEMPLDAFSPDELDCEQWIRTAKEAGAAYAILVCKHHDGFANWPSAYTEYSIKNTPFRGGKGDIVREFTDACRKYGLKVGLYYSPAEFGYKNRTAKEYDDYFINQISELLTGYGTVDYLWFDGCGSEGHEYDTKRIVREIRRMQPNILIFNMWDPDTRWVGNEMGAAPLANHNTVKMLDFSVQTDVKDELDKERFLPVECDCRIRKSNWFYSDNDAHTRKSVDELVGLYYYSVGRGANLLINIGPDRRGLLPEDDAKRLIAFGQEIRRRFRTPIPAEEPRWEGNVCTLLFSEETLVDHLVLEEDLCSPEPVQDFCIRVYPYVDGGSPIVVYRGCTIGHKAICQFPPFSTQKVDIVISSPEKKASLSRIAAYFSDPANAAH